MESSQEQKKRPIRADEIREGERYELSGGEALEVQRGKQKKRAARPSCF